MDRVVGKCLLVKKVAILDNDACITLTMDGLGQPYLYDARWVRRATEIEIRDYWAERADSP